MPLTIFLSHATHDDETAPGLRAALAPYEVSVWADSQRLRGGEPFPQRIREAIQAAQHGVVLVSQQALTRPWVREEVRIAQAVKRQRGVGYKVIPVRYADVSNEALKELCGEPLTCVPLSTGPNAVAEAVPALLAALGLAQPDDPRRPTVLESAPLAELTLCLSQPTMVEHEGTYRATALAELRYLPLHTLPTAPPIPRWRRWLTLRPLLAPTVPVPPGAPYHVTAPLGPLEAGELSWYLERYVMWPSQPFQRRAQEVESALPRWGQDLYALLKTSPQAAEVLHAWRHDAGPHARRQPRLSILLHEPDLAGADEATQRQARQAATQWLALPWELLHDGEGFFISGRPWGARAAAVAGAARLAAAGH